jgi:hypothetical protein
LAWAEQHFQELSDGERFSLNTARLKEPIEVAALSDFGLTPRHLKNSFETMSKYEKDNPRIAAAVSAGLQEVEASLDQSGCASSRIHWLHRRIGA